MMSSKGRNALDSKGSSKTSAQSRKNNRRRSQRNVSLSNGDQDGDPKERASKRGRDANKDDYGYDEYSQEVYKVRINRFFLFFFYLKWLKLQYNYSFYICDSLQRTLTANIEFNFKPILRLSTLRF